LSAAFVLTGTYAQAQTVTYIHNDPAGTPVLATDANGNVVWKETHRPYGQKLHNPAAALDDSIGFAGKPFDSDTGLSYMGARYYDPVLGRFTGIDPREVNPFDAHSFNRYAYANNNPYRYVDPDGKMSVGIAALAVLTALVVGAKLADNQSARNQQQASEVTRGLARMYDRVFNPEVESDKAMPSASGGNPNAYAKPPKNAYDPNGPKAPGKPPKNVGFEDPKGGENWVPNPNPGRGGGSHGWQDANGDVWVPTGQGSNAHGGPHWDVQSPGGGYRNVRPPKTDANGSAS
jgi:RHS repeat-associated protein